MAKVVLIEDQAEILKLFVEELVTAGHEVVSRRNGRDGLKAILTERPDIIICDNLMPGMSGGEVLARLRSEHPEFNETPFIMMSALPNRREIERGIIPGATAYLSKPLNLGELHSTLDVILLNI